MRCFAAAFLLCAVRGALAASPPPTTTDVALLTVAEASLAADMLQTLDIKRHPDRTWDYHGTTLITRGSWETNPILGAHPSDAKIAVYFLSAAVITGVTWYALPPRFRILVPLVVLAIQIPQIANNASAGLSIRF